MTDSYPAIRHLVSRRTLTQIGADLRTGSGSDRFEWRLRAPAYVSEPGLCYLVIERDVHGTYTVAIWRDGSGPLVTVEAQRQLVTALDVDRVVLEVCRGTE